MMIEQLNIYHSFFSHFIMCLDVKLSKVYDIMMALHNTIIHSNTLFQKKIIPRKKAVFVIPLLFICETHHQHIFSLIFLNIGIRERVEKKHSIYAYKNIGII